MRLFGLWGDAVLFGDEVLRSRLIFGRSLGSCAPGTSHMPTSGGRQEVVMITVKPLTAEGRVKTAHSSSMKILCRRKVLVGFSTPRICGASLGEFVIDRGNQRLGEI